MSDAWNLSATAVGSQSPLRARPPEQFPAGALRPDPELGAALGVDADRRAAVVALVARRVIGADAEARFCGQAVRGTPAHRIHMTDDPPPLRVGPVVDQMPAVVHADVDRRAA